MVDKLFEKQNMFCEKCLLLNFPSSGMNIEKVLGAIGLFLGKTVSSPCEYSKIHTRVDRFFYPLGDILT